MNLTFPELKCPCCQGNMSGSGGQFGGRVTIANFRCDDCNQMIFIIPMMKEYEYSISATTAQERKEKQIEDAKKKSEQLLAEQIAQIEKQYS